MRMIRLNPAWALGLALALSACQAPLSPVTTQQEGQSLRLRLVPSDGMRLLAVPAKRTLADVDRLEVFLQIKSGADFVAIDTASGEPSAETRHPMKLSVTGALDPGLSLTFSKLKANTEYRILARAYAGNTLISDDARSAVVVSVSNRQVLDPVTVPLAIATPFGATTQVSLSLWGAARRIDHVRASLSDPLKGVMARVNVPSASLSKALNLAALRANTTYTLELEAFEKGNGVAIATASAPIPVLNDETVSARSIPLSIKGDMRWSYFQYLSIDGTGNFHASLAKNSQTAADIVTYSPQGTILSSFELPFRVDGIAASPDGVRYVNGSPPGAGSQALRLTSDTGDYEVLSATTGTLFVDGDGNCYVPNGFAAYKYAPGSTTGTKLVTSPEQVRSVCPGPGGALYLATWNGNIYRVPEPGATPVLLASGFVTSIIGMMMREDGKLLVLAFLDKVYAIDVITGSREAVVTPDGTWSLFKDVQGNYYSAGNSYVTVF